MTSEVRTNSLKSRAGLSTVTMTDSGPIISGVTTANNFKSGISNLHSLGLTLSGGQIDVGSNIKIGTAGVVTATSFVGSGANLTGLPAGTTINSNADNRVITGSGTANTLNAESNLTFTGSILTVTNSSGASELTLVTPSNTDGGVYFNDGSNSGALSYNHSDNSMRFRVNGTNKLIIDSSGNLEITGKLTFAGDGHTKGIELGADADLVLYHDNSDAYFDNNKGDFYIRNDGNSTSEVLRLQAKGGENSIICTPNAGVSLYYDNSRKFFTQNLGCTVESTGNTPELTFRGASNLDMGKIDVDQFATNYSMMRFFTLTNGTETEYARILDNGNFCVGGMIGSSNNNNIQSPGQGNGNTNIGSAMHVSGRFICNSSSSYSSFGRNSTGLVVSFTRQGGDQGGITVGVGYVTYGSGSDYRLKENVAPLTDAITRIKQLEPKRFNFIQDTTDTLRDGFLAHEVSSIVPEAITGTKDEVDSDNNPVYQQIDQAKLVPLLTASIQELITKVETLEQENIALRVRVTNLEDN